MTGTPSRRQSWYCSHDFPLTNSLSIVGLDVNMILPEALRMAPTFKYRLSPVMMFSLRGLLRDIIATRFIQLRRNSLHGPKSSRTT